MIIKSQIVSTSPTPRGSPGKARALVTASRQYGAATAAAQLLAAAAAAAAAAATAPAAAAAAATHNLP